MSIGIILIFLLIALVFAIGAIIPRRGQGPTSLTGEPICGKCGYNVKGLTTLTCPECGSDFREVGIVKPRVKGAPGLWGKLIGFVVGWFFVGMLVGRALGADQTHAKIWLMIWGPGLIGGAVVIAVLHGRKSKRMASLAADVSDAPAPMNRRDGASTRTATVMFSDMADFTATAAATQRDALVELVRRHRDIVAPIVKPRGGKIVKSMGDGLLISFDSATDALLAGTEIQSALAQHNAAAFNEREKFNLRIAVATGEATFTDGDIFGHTVNLASRVQQLATNGDVYFTDSTFHAINRNEIGCESVGEFDLKGIGNVNVYRATKPS